MKINCRRLKAFWLFLFIFFPYVTIFDFGTDLQPWAMIYAFLLSLSFVKRFNGSELLLVYLLAFSLSMILISELNFSSIRSISGYMSLFFITFASYRVLKQKNFDHNKLMKFSIIIWVLVGFIQLLFDKSFASQILPRASSAGARGVVGLAPEPSYYGITMIFFILLLAHSNTKNKFVYVLICVATIFFLAQSAMNILFLFLGLLIYLVINLKLKYILFLTVTILSAPLLIELINFDSRAINLARVLLENPSMLLYTDASINDRFFHIFLSVKGAFDNYLLPGGFSTWNDYAFDMSRQMSDLIIIEWFSINGRIMSGYGSSLYELGVFGLLLPAIITRQLWVLYKERMRVFLVFAASINLLMMNAIPIGFPLFCFYLGYLNFLVSERGQSLKGKV